MEERATEPNQETAPAGDTKTRGTAPEGTGAKGTAPAGNTETRDTALQEKAPESAGTHEAAPQEKAPEVAETPKTAQGIAETQESSVRVSSPVLSFFRARFKKQLYAALIAAALLLLLLLALVLFLPSGNGGEEADTRSFAARVLEGTLHFLERARLNPFDAFSQYASASAYDYFREISETLWQTVLPDLGWRWFFYGALTTMAEDPPQGEGGENGGASAEALVSFYHPWSDTALITVWGEEERELRITDCEILMGDVFRTRGGQRAATTRAWARRQQYFTAAIGNVAAASLRALETLSYVSNTSAASAASAADAATTAGGTSGRNGGGQNDGTASPDANSWRARIPFILDPNTLEANHAGAGILLLAAINDVARYSAPTNVFAIRVLPTLQRLHSPTNSIKIAPEAYAGLREIPANFLEYYVPAFYANSDMRAFLLLQAKRDPKKCLSFLFGLEPPEGEDGTPKKQEEPAEAEPQLVYDETVEEEEEPEGMYPEAYYTIKLLRVDLLDIQAVYTNLYPQGGAKK